MKNIARINMCFQSGKIIDIKERETNGNLFRTFVLQADSRKDNYVPFKLIKSLDTEIGSKLKRGDTVVLNGGLYGRKYKDNYYLDFMAHTCYVDESLDGSAGEPLPVPVENDEDLPF